MLIPPMRIAVIGSIKGRHEILNGYIQGKANL